MLTKEDILQRYLVYQDDPWEFSQNCVFTRDAVDEDNPIKQFPNHDYVKFLMRLWQHEKKLLIPKSRRMFCSWNMITLALWDCIFHKGREWAFVSKKEDDSAELVARAEFIFNKIPPDILPKSLLPAIKGGRMLKSPPKLEFDYGNGETSYIAGFPVGSDQLRQFTFSGIFIDEAAFMREAEEFYTGAKPTTDGGGRMVMVSSRSPGFFKKLVFDKLDAKSSNFSEVPPVTPKQPMQGIEVWKNPNNGFCVASLHYTAHPDKRAPEFKAELKKTLPMHQYLREYEAQWETFSGMPVFPNFRRDIHVAKSDIHPQVGLPLLFGWDMGLTGACVMGQLCGNKIKIYKEWVAQNEGINIFAPKVMSEVMQMYPQWSNVQRDHYHFIDPAGFQRAQTNAQTCAQEMTENAPIYNVEPGAKGNNEFESRRMAVEKYLLLIDKDGAGFELHPTQCPSTIGGFSGGYRYDDRQAEIESKTPLPIKDAYSHPMDAVQYLCYGASQKLSTYLDQLDIPAPDYGFTHTKAQPQRKLKYGTY